MDKLDIFTQINFATPRQLTPKAHWYIGPILTKPGKKKILGCLESNILQNIKGSYPSAKGDKCKKMKIL